MATIDKLALKLDIEGGLAFIKSLDDVDEKVKETRKIVAELTRGKDDLNKSLSKNPKAKGGKKKGKKEPVSEFDKVVGNATSSLGKFVAGFSVAGLALKAVSAVFEQSAKAAQIGTSLSNQTRNTSIKTEEVETVQTTLKMMSLNEGALDGLLSDLSDNQNKFRAYGGGNDKIQNLIAMLNGFDKSGNKLSSGDTNPIQSLNAIAKMLQSNDETTKNGLVSQMMAMGISSDAVKALTNPNYFKFSKSAGALAIQTADLTKKAEDNKAADELAKKYKENEELKLFSRGSNVGRSFDEVTAKTYKGINSFIDSVDAVGNKNYIIDSITKYQKTEISEFDKTIKNIDKKNKVITFNDGSSYSGGFFDKLTTRDFINDHIQELLNPSVSYQQMENQSASQKQNININEINIQTSASHIDTINSEAINQAKIITGDPSNMVNYIGNTM